MNKIAFNFNRFLAVVIKEFIQMRRDRMTFAMMVAGMLFGVSAGTSMMPSCDARGPFMTYEPRFAVGGAMTVRKPWKHNCTRKFGAAGENVGNVCAVNVAWKPSCLVR